MVQPKTPPISIRPGDERLARIDAYAAEHNLNRHLAILLMLDEGYRSLTAVIETPLPGEVGGPGVGLPPRPVKVKGVVTEPKPVTLKAAPEVDRAFGPAKLDYGARLKKR